MHRRISIRAKVVATIVIVVMTNLLIGAVGMIGLTRVQQALEDTINVHAVNTDYIRAAGVDLHQLLIAQRAMYNFEPGTDEFNEQKEDYEKQLGQIQERFSAYRENRSSIAGEEELIQKFEDAFGTYSTISGDITTSLASSDPATRKQANERSFGEGFEHFDATESALDEIGDLYGEDNSRMLEQAKADYKRIVAISLGAILACVIVTSLLGFVIIRSVIRPIRHLRAGVSRMADGDLTLSLEAINDDEFGALTNDFNAMVDRTKTLIGTVNHSLSEVGRASDQVSAIAVETSATSEEIEHALTDIAHGAATQAALTESANLKTQHLSQLVERVHGSAANIASLSERAESVLVAGADQMGSLQTHAKETDQANGEITETIGSLASRMNGIREIVHTIYGIADQTKLLALNASIEAARAGESGQGFAVVASEIRKLATQASSSTSEIYETIDGLGREFADAMRVMGRTETLAAEQSGMVKEAAAAFQSVAETVNAILASVQDVNDGVGEVRILKETVVASIRQIADVAHNAAAATEQISASSSDQKSASKALSVSAERMRDLNHRVAELIRTFKTEQSSS
ncbi:methyl-accepting chemotaxis protein [Paenibacillus xanthanilyticus]|uniref:Methyl-accepting chemotaxis protein n=1 Tax=Paenibacillus xanthanilyticus TaxID=1783531 RepID=A0ABV8K2D8_9BACL